MKTLMEAVRAYVDRFDEGPPVLGMDEAEAIAMIEEALHAGKPIEDGPESQLPPGAII